jgi:hypothetical protein
MSWASQYFGGAQMGASAEIGKSNFREIRDLGCEFGGQPSQFFFNKINYQCSITRINFEQKFRIHRRRCTCVRPYGSYLIESAMSDFGLSRILWTREANDVTSADETALGI